MLCQLFMKKENASIAVMAASLCLLLETFAFKHLSLPLASSLLFLSKHTLTFILAAKKLLGSPFEITLKRLKEK